MNLQPHLPGFPSPSVRCSVCGRILRDKKSIAAGVGPVCGGKRAASLKSAIETIQNGGPMDEVREAGRVLLGEVERLKKLKGIASAIKN
jgi:hypothetical protein